MTHKAVLLTAQDRFWKIDSKKSVPKLTGYLSSSNQLIRAFAALSLIELGAGKQVPADRTDDIRIFLDWENGYAQRASYALLSLEATN